MQYSTRYIDVAHRVARHVARRCSYSFKINSIVFSVRLNPPIPIFSFQFEVFHEIHRCHTSCRATCRATLQLQFQSQFHRVQRTPKPSNTNFQLSICSIQRDISMSHFVSRDMSRHVVRRCSYRYKTDPIVFSVRLNPPIPIFSFQYEVFHEIHRCRTSGRATCRATLQLQFQNRSHCV
jgi:hypothetical protein